MKLISVITLPYTKSTFSLNYLSTIIKHISQHYYIMHKTMTHEINSK